MCTEGEKGKSVRTSNFGTNFQHFGSRERRSLDTANGRPLAFILNRKRHNMGQVMYGGQRNDAVVSIENDRSAVKEVDGTFYRLNVLCCCVWGCQ
jgi:hypothetical protein